MALTELPALLRDDPALAALAGGSARVVAVSEAPRAFFLAGLARLTGRRPLVVGVPATADHPVRIDLWGDEVDRLQTFSVADQRATGDVGGAVEVFPCRELLPTEAVRARAEKLIGAEPWGRSQWEKLSEGLLFDGMESWLPWLTDDERLL